MSFDAFNEDDEKFDRKFDGRYYRSVKDSDALIIGCGVTAVLVLFVAFVALLSVIVSG